MGSDTPGMENRATLHVSREAAATVQRLCLTYNATTKEIIDKALEAFELRSIPAHTLLSFDSVRAIEQSNANAQRLIRLLAKIEVLVLTARRGQLEVAERLISEAQPAISKTLPNV